MREFALDKYDSSYWDHCAFFYNLAATDGPGEKPLSEAETSMKKTCLCLTLLLWPSLLPAQEPRFIRLKEQQGQAAALEVAVTRYANKDKSVMVDLVGVVHIGDRAYYKKLNERFGQYDAVLYELVAPPGTEVPKGGKSDSPFAILHTLFSTVLDLDSQLACIDYKRKNFVHADLSFEAMKEAARDRGEDGLTLGLSLLADVLRQQNVTARKKNERRPAPEVDLVEALANPNLLKRELAKQLAGGADLGQTLQTLLVADRNKEACRVLTRQLVDGKKKLAIFYGAAHMPDFDRRLRDEFGLTRQSQEWLTAWDLRDDPDAATRRIRSLLERALEEALTPRE
jgi:hypothetical protein